MKKRITLLLIALLISCVSLVYADSAKSTEELLREFDEIRNELIARELSNDEDRILLETQSYKIYISGKTSVGKRDSWNSNIYVIIPVVVINNSNQDITVEVNDASLNGWSVYGDCDGAIGIPAGKKTKARLCFIAKDADVNKLADFENAECKFEIIEANNYTRLFISDIVSIIAKNE